MILGARRQVLRRGQVILDPRHGWIAERIRKFVCGSEAERIKAHEENQVESW